MVVDQMPVAAWLFWLFVGGILYTYIGYPLLLSLLARTRPRPSVYPASTPSVTLLIAAYNEQAVIEEKLNNSLALKYPRERLQILVAADGSSDRTPDIVRSYAGQGVVLSYSPRRRGKMAAINRAIGQARGEIIVLSDANNLYDANALHELVAPFADSTVGAVSGAKSIVRGDGVLGDSEGLYWTYEAFIRAQETRLGCCTGVVGEMLALRRHLIESPPAHIINDDFYLAMCVIRRGYRVVYAPQARSYERISLSTQDEVTRRSRIVVGRYQAMLLSHQLLPLRRPLIVWQIISHKFLRPLVPLFMGGAFVTNVFCVAWPADSTTLFHLSPPVNWMLLVFQLLFYGLAGIGNRVKCTGTVGKLLYLPTFLVNSNLAALIGLYRFLTGHHTPLWQPVPRRESLGMEPTRPRRACGGRDHEKSH